MSPAAAAAAVEVTVRVPDDLPEEVIGILEQAPLEIGPTCLLQILAEQVGVHGEALHGFEERDDLGLIEQAAARAEAMRAYLRAIEILRRQEIAQNEARRQRVRAV